MKTILIILSLSFSLSSFAQNGVHLNSSYENTNGPYAILFRHYDTPNLVTLEIPYIEYTEYRQERYCSQYQNRQQCQYRDRRVCVEGNPQRCRRWRVTREPYNCRNIRSCVNYQYRQIPETRYTSKTIDIRFVGPMNRSREGWDALDMAATATSAYDVQVQLTPRQGMTFTPYWIHNEYSNGREVIVVERRGEVRR